MKTYLIIIKQSGEGCDFTIGCGLNIYNFKANTPEEAFTKWAESLSLTSDPYTFEEYDTGTYALDSVKIVEIANESNLWDKFKIERRKEIQDQRNAEKTNKELEEYLRLKRKFEK